MRRKLQLESLEHRFALAADLHVADAEGEAAVMPGFALQDVNAASATHGQSVSPQALQGQVTAWYFAHATCSYCTAQFGHLDTLQQELAATYPLLKIQILGINEAGNESGNGQITQGRTLPWLQDVDADHNGQSDVWDESWQVAFRDVVILNGAGEKVEIHNLTSHDLGTPEYFAELKQKLIDTAMQSQLPWHSAANPNDVNQNGLVTPLDALLVIIDLNANGARKLEAPLGTAPLVKLYDTNGDGYLSPLDALLIIIELNEQAAAQSTLPPAAGEGSQSLDEQVAPWAPGVVDALMQNQAKKEGRWQQLFDDGP